MIFNILLTVILLFIVMNLVYDFLKMYNSGNWNLIEGFLDGAAYPEKVELPWNQINTVKISFNKKLKQTIIPPASSFNVVIKDYSNVNVSSVNINNKNLNLVLNQGIAKENPMFAVKYTPPTTNNVKLRDDSNNVIPTFTMNGAKTKQTSMPTANSQGSWTSSFYGNFVGIYDSIMKIPTLKAKMDPCVEKCSQCKSKGGNSNWCVKCRECLHENDIISISGEFVKPSDGITVLQGKSKYSPRDINNTGIDFACPKNCVLPNSPDGNCEFVVGEEGAYWKKCRKVCSTTNAPNVPWNEMTESERKKQCWKNSDCFKCKARRHFPCNIEKGPDGKIIKWDCTTGYENAGKKWDNRRGGRNMNNRGQQKYGDDSSIFNQQPGNKRRQRKWLENADKSAGSFKKPDDKLSSYNSETTDKNNYQGTGYTKNYKPLDPKSKPSPFNSLWSIMV